MLRQPRGWSNWMTALHLVLASFVMTCFVVLGSADRRLSAEIVAILLVLFLSWQFLITIPLTLLSLYFEGWLSLNKWRVFIPMAVITVVVDAAVLLMIASSPGPLLLDITYGYWARFGFQRLANSLPHTFSIVVFSQLPVQIIIINALRLNMLPFWRRAVPFTLASTASVLVPIIAPWFGRLWMALVGGLSVMPLVLILTHVFLRSSQSRAVKSFLRDLTDRLPDGVLVLDMGGTVLAANRQAERWLGDVRLGSLSENRVSDLLRDMPPLRALVERLLADGEDQAHNQPGECTITLDGEHYVLAVSIQPLRHPSVASPLQILTIRDVTAARVRADLHERSEHLIALSASSAEINSSLQVSEVVQRALEVLLRLTHLDGAVVYLLDDSAESFTRAGSIGRQELVERAPETLAAAGTIAGRSIHEQRLVITHDTGEADAESESLRYYGLCSALTIPLIARERVVGVIQGGLVAPHDFDRVQLALFESIGHQLAVAIENARLHTQERRQREVAETLREAATTLNNRNLEDALQGILAQLARILPHDRASVLLLSEPGLLRVGAFTGFEKVSPEEKEKIYERRISISDYPHLLNLFTQHTPQIVTNTYADEDWVHKTYTYGSWIGVPLLAHDKILGCLAIGDNQPGRFTDSDLGLAEAFAAQVSVAVENANLFGMEQQRRMQAELLQRTSYDLVTSPDLHSALVAVLENLSVTLDFDSASIGLLSRDGLFWKARARYPVSVTEREPRQIPVEEYPLIAQMLRDKHALCISETSKHPLWKPGRTYGTRTQSWIGAPLLVRGEAIGALNVSCFSPHGFSQEDFQTAQLFAHQIAAAIDNFRLLDETRRQNQSLVALNSVLVAGNAAMAEENLLSTALDRILKSLDLEGAAIHEYAPQTRRLTLRASIGIPDSVLAGLDDLTQDQGWPSAPISTQSGRYYVYAVPLTSHGLEMGLLSICQPDIDGWDADMCQLFETLGQQLGVILDNAWLLREARRREEVSTDLGRLSLAISAQLDRETALDLICRESMAVFDVDGAYIYLLKDDRLVGAAAYGVNASGFVGTVCPLARKDYLPVQVLDGWRPKYVNQVADSDMLPGDVQALTGAQAAIAVPLLKADIPLGVLLLVDSEDPFAFSDWLTEQVGLLGVQAALAIQNASLFDEIRRRLDQLRLVNEVSRFATAILSPQGLIEGVAQKLFDILGYDMISLLELEHDRMTIRAMLVNESAAAGDNALDRRTPLEDVAGEAVLRTEPVLRNRSYRLLDGTQPDREIACSTLAVPLILVDEVIGVFVVERRDYDSITQEDLDVLEPLAAQLAISLSNARLFERVRQQTLELEARVVERTSEIRQQKERTEAILGSVADAVIVFDLAGQVVLTNPVAEELFQRHDLDMDLGLRIRELVDHSLFAESGNGEHTEILEMGGVALQAKASRVVEGDEMIGSVVVLRDISRLRELDRMKNLFVSNVSHELRTPLANLKLYLSLLRQGKPDRQESYIAVMEREAERLARLIADLLDLSRLDSEQRIGQTAEHGPLDLNGIVETIITDNTAAVEAQNKTLHYERCGVDLPPIMGNHDQLVRALMNLMANALNYTPEGGRITVRTRLEPLEHANSDWVIIEVADTGIGIPEEELPMIFDRFYRGSNVNPNMPGTGLGLAIIKEIVELHDGSIDVESAEHQGSTFRLRLPVYDSNNDCSSEGDQ